MADGATRSPEVTVPDMIEINRGGYTTIAGLCAACGEPVYNDEGLVDARSHPRIAIEVDEGAGALMCAVCDNDPERYRDGLARVEMATRLGIGPCPLGHYGPWRYVEAIEVWRKVVGLTEAGKLLIASEWRTGEGYNDGVDGSGYLECWAGHGTDCVERVELPQGFDEDTDIEWD